MGSKVILLLGLLASALYLYFFMNKQNITVQPKEIINSSIENNAKDDVETTIPETESSNMPVPAVDKKEEQKREEEIEIINKNERVATPAFGFMAGAEKNQIVALMSDNDENGTISKYIEELCQKSECSKDLRYENDIMDAPWQEGVGKILGLLTDGSIEGGSLFIEGNILKLEGTITSNEAQDVLNSILDSVKSDTFKIENHSKLSSNIPKTEKTEINTAEQIVKKDLTVKDEKREKENIKDENNSKQNVIQAIEEIKPDIGQEAAKVNKKEIKQQTAKKTDPIKKSKTKPKRRAHKPITKKIRVSEPEIVAEPVMETTLDLEDRIVTQHSIKENIQAEDIVAKPYMKITSEEDYKTEKRIKKSKNKKKDMVAPGKLEITDEDYIEAQREIRDLLISNPIHFEGSSSILDKGSRDTLDKIVQIVDELDGCDIVIEGYVDTDSDKVYNKVLSQKRADMVKRYLKSKNIKSKTVKSIGHGSDKVDTDSSTDSKDGKIEILFISGEAK
jgi:outer membrane protein OmpA-like peptidoglycan-associated protein